MRTYVVGQMLETQPCIVPLLIDPDKSRHHRRHMCHSAAECQLLQVSMCEMDVCKLMYRDMMQHMQRGIQGRRCLVGMSGTWSVQPDLDMSPQHKGHTQSCHGLDCTFQEHTPCSWLHVLHLDMYHVGKTIESRSDFVKI